MGSAGRRVLPRFLSLLLYFRSLLDVYKRQGTLPQAANEILVERAFLDYFEIPAEVGQTIEVNLGNGKQTYTVSGIMAVAYTHLNIWGLG